MLVSVSASATETEGAEATGSKRFAGPAGEAGCVSASASGVVVVEVVVEVETVAALLLQMAKGSTNGVVVVVDVVVEVSCL